MNIYLAHSKSFDYENSLYIPIRNSFLSKKHNFILPHEESLLPYGSRDLFENRKCDLVLAEVSNPAIWLWIALCWANLFWIKIICICKIWTKLSNSLKVVSKDFLEYNDNDDLIHVLLKILDKT